MAISDLMGDILDLVPAYGRTYTSREEVLKDWHAGKDFRVYGGGPYCSVRDKIKILKDYADIVIWWSPTQCCYAD